MKQILLIVLIFLYNAVNIKAQNPCAGVFAGSVPHPDPRRCDEYYVCIFFIGSLQQCPPNQIFDGISGNCVSGDPSTCLPITSTSTSTSTSSTSIDTTPLTTTSLPEVESTTSTTLETTTTLPELNLDEICEEVFFAARPHPHSIYLFIGCIRGDGTIHSCLNGEYFNASILECIPVPTPCQVPDDVCVGLQLEIVPHPCYCFRHIVCYIETIIMDSECPLETIFDPISKECRPGNWDTCEFYEEVSVPTTSISTSSTVSFNPCQDVQLGNRPMPGNCTMFYRCVSNVPMPQHCSTGQIFNQNQLLCVDGDERDCLNIYYII